MGAATPSGTLALEADEKGRVEYQRFHREAFCNYRAQPDSEESRGMQPSMAQEAHVSPKLAMPAFVIHFACMSKRHFIQYTVRDIPESADLRLREVAEREDISLNKAVVQALTRGLGLDSGRVRYRPLRALVRKHKGVDRKGWSEALRGMDQVNEADWA